MPKIVAHKKNWIELGYKLFSETGISGIVVEKMSKKLNCNKSSFYWHFKTKKEFIQQLTNYWVDSETGKIIKLTSFEKNASQKLKLLIEISYKKMPYLDFVFYLKRYALKENKISKIIDSIDDQRIEYVHCLLKEIGYSNRDAKIKASLLYKHLIGYHEMIRYKEQNENYLIEVKKEINQFIDY